MARSPLDARNDPASGPDRSTAPQVRGGDPRSAALHGIAASSKAWWLMKRPVGWSEAQHLQNPSVNCSDEPARELARSVAQWVQLGG